MGWGTHEAKVVDFRIKMMYFNQNQMITYVLWFWQAHYKSGGTKEVQVVQKHILDIPVATCQVTRTRTAFKCGIVDSIAYSPMNIDLDINVPLSRTECLLMVQLHRYEVETRLKDAVTTHIVKLNPNATTTASVVTEGASSRDGTCERGFFKRNGKDYNGMVETTEVI